MELITSISHISYRDKRSPFNIASMYVHLFEGGWLILVFLLEIVLLPLSDLTRIKVVRILLCELHNNTIVGRC